MTGDKHNNLPEYLIITNRPRAGLFSSVIQVLGELHFCKTRGITPVVFFSNNWVYWQAGGYHQAINGWEYYFKPVSDASIEALTGKDEKYLESCNIFDFEEARIIPNNNPDHVYDLRRKGHIKLPANVTVVNKWPDFHLGTSAFLEHNRRTAHALIAEYLYIQPRILSRVNKFYTERMQGEVVLGVHFRGLERRREIEEWYKFQFRPIHYYIYQANNYLRRYPQAKVFIATDTETTLQQFLDAFGDRCIYFDATRSGTGNSPHLEIGGAEIGEQVLIETLLLSMTDYLVHGISNVAYAALSFNPGLPHIDVYQVDSRTAIELQG